MLHHNDAELEIKQVEFNTISSSFGPLSHQVSSLHRYIASNVLCCSVTDMCEAARYLYSATSYFGLSPHLSDVNMPENETRYGLVEGLAAAHSAYKKSKYVAVAIFTGQNHLPGIMLQCKDYIRSSTERTKYIRPTVARV